MRYRPAPQVQQQQVPRMQLARMMARMMAGQPQSGMSDQAMGMLNRMGLAQLGQAKMLKDAGMNNDFGPKGIGIETYLSMGSPEYRAMQRRLGVNNDFGPEGIPIDQWLAMGQ